MRPNDSLRRQILPQTAITCHSIVFRRDPGPTALADGVVGRLSSSKVLGQPMLMGNVE